MSIDLSKLAADPMAFFEILRVPSAFGSRPFGEIMAPHQREWFEAIAPSMVAFSKSEKPPIGRFWSERTKGGSKDSDIACVMLWLLAFCPKFDAQIGAYDKDQAGELKKAAEDILRLNPWLAARVTVQSWTILCKATGSVCTILATDVAGSHGARPDIVCVNELSHITKEEFASNLLDNATKKPNGLVIVATNAGFLGSWQEQWREIARTSDRWNFHTLSVPSPWLTEAEIEEARKRNSTARFQRLFYGKWVRQIGDALDDADIQAAINPNLVPGLIRPGELYVAGLDLGIKHDHSALVVVAINTKTLRLRLAWAQSWKPRVETGKVDLIAVERDVIAAHRKFRLRSLGYDPYQAALLAQRAEQQRVPMVEVPFTGASLNLMASTLLEVFRSRRLELYDLPQLVDDLSRLSIEEKAYGHRLSATSNESGHADLATALAIALPIAVELASNPPVILKPMFGAGADGTFGQSRFAQYCENERDYEREQAFLNNDTDPSGFLDAIRDGSIQFHGERNPFQID